MLQLSDNLKIKTKTLKNKITAMRGSSEFLGFILDRNDSLILSPARKNGKMFTYSPVGVERKFGITPKNQRAILRILKDDYHCLSYEFSPYDGIDEKLKSNWHWYKKLVEEFNLSHEEALERIRYKKVRVSVRNNCKEVFRELFYLDAVAYEITLKNILNSNGQITSMLLYFGKYPISKMNAGSQTCKVAEELFEERRRNGENVVLKKVSNLSDTLSRIVDKIPEIKALVFGDIKGNSVKVYQKITNEMLMRHGLSKECVDDIMLHHFKK